MYIMFTKVAFTFFIAVHAKMKLMKTWCTITRDFINMGAHPPLLWAHGGTGNPPGPLLPLLRHLLPYPPQGYLGDEWVPPPVEWVQGITVYNIPLQSNFITKSLLLKSLKIIKRVRRQNTPEMGVTIIIKFINYRRYIFFFSNFFYI